MMRGFYCFLTWLLLLSVNAWATAPVFYSLSANGTGTMETGDGNITITSGIATLTVAQTGNIGAGVCIEYNSLECWIAPNRIGFDSGSNSTGMSPGVKITDATSSATGIIRYTETTSGNWTLGTAAGWIYFESTDGTFGNNNIINGTKPTSISNIATVDGTIQGNIGGGNTEFVVKSAIGGIPSNQASCAITSIHHEYASLSAFEAGFTDSSHVNNVSLVSADVVAFACYYYDHGDYTADTSAVNIGFGTTGINNNLQIYTPVGGTESINSQRHDGKLNANKQRLSLSGTCYLGEDFIRLEGLQFDFTGSGNVEIAAQTDANSNISIDSCIIHSDNSATSNLLYLNDANINVVFVNSIIYEGLMGCKENVSCHPCFYCCTVYNITGYAALHSRGNGIITNCAVFNNADDFSGGTITYCASDDGDGSDAVQWTSGATDWANVFEAYATGDFHLKNFSGTGAIIDQGTPLSSEGIWRDIDGDERGASWDIGADEYVSAGASTAAQMIMIIQ